MFTNFINSAWWDKKYSKLRGSDLQSVLIALIFIPYIAEE